MMQEMKYYVLSDKEKKSFLISSDYVRGPNHEVTDDVYEAKRFKTKDEVSDFIEDYSVNPRYQTISKVNITISIE